MIGFTAPEAELSIAVVLPFFIRNGASWSVRLLLLGLVGAGAGAGGFLGIMVGIRGGFAGDFRLRPGSFRRILLLLAGIVHPLVDGNTLFDEILEVVGFREVNQSLLDFGVEAFIKHGALGIVVDSNGEAMYWNSAA